MTVRELYQRAVDMGVRMYHPDRNPVMERTFLDLVDEMGHQIYTDGRANRGEARYVACAIGALLAGAYGPEEGRRRMLESIVATRKRVTYILADFCDQPWDEDLLMYKVLSMEDLFEGGSVDLGIEPYDMDATIRRIFPD